jgi:hypothetical protein
MEHGRGKVKPAQLERWADLLGASLKLTGVNENDSPERAPAAPARSAHA